jgi:hypothetical protein
MVKTLNHSIRTTHISAPAFWSLLVVFGILVGLGLHAEHLRHGVPTECIMACLLAIVTMTTITGVLLTKRIPFGEGIEKPSLPREPGLLQVFAAAVISGMRLFKMAAHASLKIKSAKIKSASSENYFIAPLPPTAGGVAVCLTPRIFVSPSLGQFSSAH